MYRELTKKDISWAVEMLRRINRSAQELFQKAVLDGSIVKAHIYEYDNNIGIVSVLQGEDYYSVQVSFREDVYRYDVIYELEQEIRQVLSVKGSRDVYLNVNGYNVILCNALMNLGFVRDALGFEFVLQKAEAEIERYEAVQRTGELIIRRYQEEYAWNYLCLLDDAFRQQNTVCGQEQDVYKNVYAEYQKSKMKQADEDGDFFAFWRNEELIGLCIFTGNYMDIIAVAPKFEGKGFGSEMLKCCIQDRWNVKEYSEVYLHTYLQNRRAQSLYLKYGFKLQGFYSENTFVEKLMF